MKLLHKHSKGDDKEWLATLDGRTRHSHAMLDGEQVAQDAKFSNGCRFPGDPQGPPWEVYNCRCTLIAAVDGVDTSDAERWSRDPETGERKLVSDMTYQEWAKQKESENKTVWDTYMKKGKNLSSDREQWQEYRSILGEEVPGTLDSFQDLKYNDFEKWKFLQGYKRYKVMVPEATAQDYTDYRAVKATGVIGTVRVPPEKIDVDALDFKDEHGTHHGCTLEDAKHYIRNAKCSIRRARWDGMHTNYYSLDGAAYVQDEIHKINTAFPKAKFDPDTKAIVEVFE